MKEQFQLFRQRVRTQMAERRHYFCEAANDIAAANLSLLCTVTAATLILLLLLLAAASLLLPRWVPSAIHIAFLPIAFLFVLAAQLCRREEPHRPRFITFLCVLFLVALFVFMILLDTVLYPDVACNFTPIFLTACPMIFILPVTLTAPLLVTAEVIFAAFALLFKEPFIASNDIFSSLAGLSFGLVLSHTITGLRLGDYHAKTNYRSLSMTDALTGLANKAAGENMMRKYLSVRDLSHECALLIVDLDHFKQVNDRMGHQMGDQLLAAVGRELFKTFRSGDIVGRFGGDEYVVLMKDVPADEIVERKCLQTLELVNRQVRALGISDDFLCNSCSIGAAVTRRAYVSYDELFRLADDALYEAKALGRGRHVLRACHAAMHTGTKPLMLIADDDSVARIILRTMFQSDFSILETDNGSGALGLLSEYSDQIKIVLLDITMPGVDGYTVLQHLVSKTATRHIPVVVISSDAQNEERALTAGAADMLTKPLDPAVAKLRVGNVLKRVPAM